MNNMYPIFAKIEGKPCLVVGGGAVAEQKIRQLLNCRAKVTVIAPKINKYVRSCVKDGNLILHLKKYEAGDIIEYNLVIGATDDEDVNINVYDEAVRKNIPVNIVDKPELCTFFLGSVFQEGDLKISVSTNGKSPLLGKIIRDRLKDGLKKNTGELLTDLGNARKKIHAMYKDPAKRKFELERIVNNKVRKDERSNNSYKKGTVLLVGAGPGDPELITVKGLNAIKNADVVVYDALVNKKLLTYAKDNALLIYAGKRHSDHFIEQESINEVLINQASEGKLVVRLKGGDPFVFGRGGEEAEALSDADIPFVIIPGVTSGIAVPAYAGIPVTHRNYTSSFTFVNGHKNFGQRSKINWKALVESGSTLSIYMGVKSLPSIVDSLIKNGCSNKTPVAVIQDGTYRNQKIVVGTLDNIIRIVEESKVEPPAIILVGKVVNLHSRLNWYGKELNSDYKAVLKGAAK